MFSGPALFFPLQEQIDTVDDRGPMLPFAKSD